MVQCKRDKRQPTGYIFGDLHQFDIEIPYQKSVDISSIMKDELCRKDDIDSA